MHKDYLIQLLDVCISAEAPKTKVVLVSDQVDSVVDLPWLCAPGLS